MIAMVFFDEETEQICRDLDYNLILPPDSLRRHLDSRSSPRDSVKRPARHRYRTCWPVPTTTGSCAR